MKKKEKSFLTGDRFVKFGGAPRLSRAITKRRRRRHASEGETGAHLAHLAMHLARAARRRRLVHYPCNYEKSYVPVRITVKHSVQQVNADRDVNQKSKAINWRGRARTLCTLESVRRYPPLSLAGRVNPVFFEAREEDPDPRACSFLSSLPVFFRSRDLDLQQQ